MHFFFDTKELKQLLANGSNSLFACRQQAALCKQALQLVGVHTEIVRSGRALVKHSRNTEQKNLLMGTEPLTPSAMGVRNWSRKMMQHTLLLTGNLFPIAVHEADVEPTGTYHIVQTSSGDNRKFIVRIGDAISQTERIELYDEGISLRKYIKSVLYCMNSALNPKTFLRKKPERDTTEPIADEKNEDVIAGELSNLSETDLLFSAAEFKVFVCNAAQIPESIKEIGRLREISFRQAGEGTNKSRDLDEFDLYYEQLIIWDAKNKRIAGGYRMGNGSKIMAQHGIKGFYCSSLFKIDEAFTQYLQQALELGRSYVVPEYQKHRLPLFLLWKGIFHYLQKNKSLQFLLGPVSISKYYSQVSQQLIVSFIYENCFDTKLAAMVKPRKKFHFDQRLNDELLLKSMHGQLDRLDDFIQQIEPAHFKMPVLVRRYLQLNAKIIAFNIDPNFNDALDGFLFLDLKNVPAEMLQSLQKE